MATAKKPARKTPVRAKGASTTTAVPAAPVKAAAGRKTAAPTKAAKPAKPAKVAKPEKADKADKPRKPKIVRDSFTIPKAEYAVLEALKQRAARLGRPTKKGEVLRAGVKALEAMSDAAFLASVGAVPALKTGRPAKA